MYTLSRWLLPGQNANQMATLQPVAMRPNDFWTDDFRTAVKWLRSEDRGKRTTLGDAQALINVIPPGVAGQTDFDRLRTTTPATIRASPASAVASRRWPNRYQPTSVISAMPTPDQIA